MSGRPATSGDATLIRPPRVSERTATRIYAIGTAGKLNANLAESEGQEEAAEKTGVHAVFEWFNGSLPGAYRFQVFIGLDNLPQQVFRGPVAAIDIRVMTLDQRLEAPFDVGGRRARIESQDIERLALRIMDGALL